jgi:hypothetical protein
LKIKKTADESKSTLHSIYAGGDQTFVITMPASSNVVPIDHRHVLKQTHILSADIIEQFDHKPITQPIVKENSSKITSVAILNPSEL